MGLFSGLLDFGKSVIGGVTDFLGGGVGDLLGSLAGGAASTVGQNSANDANRDIAREQMGFQERMSNTSYQRATRDMMQAGLNPMLAYTQGGASTPSGASAVMQNALTPAVNSAIAARRLSADVDNIKAQTSKVTQDERTSISAEALNRALIHKSEQDAKLSSNSAANVAIQTKLNQAELPKANVLKSGYNAIENVVNKAANSAKAATSKVNSISDFLKMFYPPDPKTGGYHYNPPK